VHRNPQMLGQMIKQAYMNSFDTGVTLVPDLTQTALYARTQLVVSSVDTKALLNSYPIRDDASIVLEVFVERVHSCTFITRLSKVGELGIEVERPEDGYEAVIAGAFPLSQSPTSIILDGLVAMSEAQCIVLAVQYDVSSNNKMAVVLDLSSLELRKPDLIYGRAFRCFIVDDVQVGSIHTLQLPPL